MAGEPKTLKELRASKRVQPYLEQAEKISAAFDVRAIFKSLNRMFVAANPSAAKKDPKLKVRIPRTIEREADIKKLQQALADAQTYRDITTYQINNVLDVQQQLKRLRKKAWDEVQEWKGWRVYDKRVKDLEDAKAVVFAEIDEVLASCDFVLKVAEEIKWNLKSTLDTLSKMEDAAVHDYHRGNREWK